MIALWVAAIALTSVIGLYVALSAVFRALAWWWFNREG